MIYYNENLSSSNITINQLSNCKLSKNALIYFLGFFKVIKAFSCFKVENKEVKSNDFGEVLFKFKHMILSGENSIVNSAGSRI